MRIYRVEDEEGIGPYRMREFDDDKNNLADDLCRTHDGVSDHPTPDNDFNHYISSKEVCAFVSLNDLNVWFDEFLDRLEDCGYLITEYDVPTESVIGGHTFTGQCVVPRCVLKKSERRILH